MSNFTVSEVSSESPSFPGNNLTLSKSWETGKPFPEVFVVVSFQTQIIHSIKLEPINARFIEILVSKDHDKFDTLLSKTAVDSRLYTFNMSNFDHKDIARQEWNRMKVILYQKEFKLCLGLKSLELNSPQFTSSIEVPDISDNERENVNTSPVVPKSTFEKKETLPPPPKPVTNDIMDVEETKKRKKDTSTEEDEPTSSKKPKKKKKVYKFKPIVTSSEDEKEVEPTKKEDLKSVEEKKVPSSQPSSNDKMDKNKKESSSPKPIPEKKKNTSDAPLSKVVLVISGIANPERAELKDIAMSLGAQYRPNWTKDSTHLICAMENTDKFHEAKNAGGKVVTKDWIYACQKKNKKMPEGKYGFGKVETLKGGDDDDETDEDERYELNSDDEKFIDDSEVVDPPSDDEFDPDTIQEEEDPTTPLFEDEPITPKTPKSASPKEPKTPSFSSSFPTDVKPSSQSTSSDPNVSKIKLEIEKVKEKGKDPIPFIEETFEKVKEFARKGDASEIYEHWNENVPVFSEIRKSIHSIENQHDLIKALDQWKKIYLQQAQGAPDLLDFLSDVKAYLDPSIKDNKKATRLIYAYGGETTTKVEEATHILCEEDATPSYKKGLIVSIQWIIQCHQKKKLVNIQPFII